MRDLEPAAGAAAGQRPADAVKPGGSRPGIGARRQVGDQRSAAVLHVVAREGADILDLAAVETAAVHVGEDLKGLVGFREADRVALAVILRDGAGDVVARQAAGERQPQGCGKGDLTRQTPGCRRARGVRDDGRERVSHG